MGIKSKVLVTNFVTYLVYMFIAIAAVAFVIRGQLTEAAKQENKVIVESIGNVILQDFVKFERSVTYLSQEQTAKDFLANPSIENFERTEVVVRNTLAGADDYDFAYILDTGGLTIFSTEKELLYNNYDFRPYFQNALNGRVTITSAIGVTTNEPGFYASAPIFEDIDGKRSVIGVIVIKFRPDLLFDTIEQSDFDNVSISDISLVDQHGLIFETNNETQLYKTVGLPSVGTISRIEESQILSSNNLEYLGYNKVQEFIEEKREGYYQVVEEGNTNLSSSVYKIPGYNYFVFSQFDFSDYGSALQNILLLVVGIVPFILLIGAVLTSRIISQQLKVFDNFLSSIQSAIKNKAKLVLDTTVPQLKETQDIYNDLIDDMYKITNESKSNTNQKTPYDEEIEQLKSENEKLKTRLEETEKFSEEITALLKSNKND
ncbi:hypothetical protein KC669_01775 [Candidatus Dojkabacteria bacterium]|uniref:Cache domain-containing protein n=1 Tax=Candidatus Dojkabacteria bacterium TaxID=2099670 RepID=A0A955RL67_9BACT|nr:hypothetical protein [Candidatus Dojkabacteria bacterium]